MGSKFAISNYFGLCLINSRDTDTKISKQCLATKVLLFYLQFFFNTRLIISSTWWLDLILTNPGRTGCVVLRHPVRKGWAFLDLNDIQLPDCGARTEQAVQDLYNVLDWQQRQVYDNTVNFLLGLCKNPDNNITADHYHHLVCQMAVQYNIKIKHNKISKTYNTIK